MIAASPSLFCAWDFWASSAHPREAESDSFLVCAARNKTEACCGVHATGARATMHATGARATMHAVALIYNDRGCQSGVARDAALSDRIFFLTTPIAIPIRITWYLVSR